MTRISSVEVVDVRFPTSLRHDGSDAMNPDGDHSAAYLTLNTDAGMSGYGLTFTIGRGTELCVAAARQLAAPLVGLDVDELQTGHALGDIYRLVVGDSQMRWLGPEKGVVHLAAAAVLNAVWDLAARAAGKPLWQLLCDMPPEDLVAACDWTYLTDVLSQQEATDMLHALAPTREQRRTELLATGYPAYTSAPGWLGYSDDKLRRLCREAIAAGWNSIKLKVGGRLEDDIRRCHIARGELGADRTLLLDANQVWNVQQAIDWTKELAAFNPLWIEEPTSPDDIVGHATIRRSIAPIGVATGEHAHNRVMFKQFLQLEAMDFCQIDACRVASINELVPILLLAAKHDTPVCPHSGGVGLSEYVQHLAAFDYIAISASLNRRLVEYVDHVQEHLTHPATIIDGKYQIPTAPGYGTQLQRASITRYRYPDGRYWSTH